MVGGMRKTYPNVRFYRRITGPKIPIKNRKPGHAPPYPAGSQKGLFST